MYSNQKIKSVFYRTFMFMVVLVVQCTSAYRKYYVEDECVSPNKFQKIFFRLPPSGPDSVGELRSNRFGTYSGTGRNCLIKLKPPKGHGIIITVLKVDFRNHNSCKDYIKIFESDDDGEKLCGYQELGLNGKTFFSDDDIKILYHTSEGGMGFNDGFKLIFTVTKLDEDAATCSSPEDFKCDNSHCIWAGVTCDGINNCGDASDEKSTEHPHCPNVTPIAVAATVLGITSFIAILVTMCICCCRGQPDKPTKPPLVEDFPYRPNGGYIPLPGYTYGSMNTTIGHLQPVHSPAVQTEVQPSAPIDYSRYIQPKSEVPFIHQKVEIRYDRPPP
ncbi:Low-density lipoprotein receptor-related protein 3, partial [Stegodyphus mimosarum]